MRNPILPNSLTSFRELLENEYIGGWDLKRDGVFADFTLTIASVEKFTPRQRKRGERVRRFVVRFAEAEKPWLAGPASGEIIKGLYGPPSEWPGKKITLYYDESIRFGTKKVGGVRPRPVLPRGAAVSEMVSQPVDAEMRAAQNEAADAI